MTEPEIVILPNPADASHAAAIRIGARLTRAVERRGVAHWVTTGGSTPGRIYEHLADRPLRDNVPWNKVHLWWTDERWVPPDNILSNALACWDILLRDVPIPPEQVHVMPIRDAMDAGEGPGWVAARYAEALRSADLDLDQAGFPVMDVVLVGVGSDGHVFSVFPDSATLDDPAWVQSVPAPKHIAPHVERVTLNPGILSAARQPIVVVQGAGKAPILGDLFGPERDIRRLPAQLARRADAVWFLDAAAAEGLPPDLPVTRAGPITGRVDDEPSGSGT